MKTARSKERNGRTHTDRRQLNERDGKPYNENEEEVKEIRRIAIYTVWYYTHRNRYQNR